MAFKRIIEGDKSFNPQPGDSWIAITSGISGHFAIQWWMNDEQIPPFQEPYNSGIGRYKDEYSAACEAVMWAQDEEMPCVLSDELWNELILKGVVAV